MKSVSVADEPLALCSMLTMGHDQMQELDHLTNSFGQLKQAQTKFKSCVNDVNELKAGSGSRFDSPLSFLVSCREEMMTKSWADLSEKMS